MTANSRGRARRLSMGLLGAMVIMAQAPAALAEQVERSIAAELMPLAGLKAPNSELKVDVWANRADGEYLPGEALQLYVRTNQDARITVLATDAMGRTKLIFPNAFSDAVTIAGNTVSPIPPDGTLRLTVAEPYGTNMIKVLATTPAVDPLKGITAGQTSGPFRSLAESPEIIARAVAAAMAENGGYWATSDLLFGVVRTRGTAAAVSGSEFGLRLELDKMSYRIGDVVTIRLTPERDCNAIVLNINEAQGKAVVLYGNETLKAVPLHAGETTRLPGPDSGVRLAVMGPAGPQKMVALCGEGNLDLLQQFKSADTRAIQPVITTDQWAQVGNPPRTARAEVAFTVQP